MNIKFKQTSDIYPTSVCEGVKHSINQANSGELTHYTGIKKMLLAEFRYLSLVPWLVAGDKFWPTCPPVPPPGRIDLNGTVVMMSVVTYSFLNI